MPKRSFMGKQAFTFSGDAAKSYDQYLGPFLFEPSAVIMSSLVTEGFKGKVLEIAAGSGRLTRHLARRVADPSQLVVTDLSQDMLEIAKQRVAQAGIQYQVEDMQGLSFPDQSFELVICQYGVMFPPDKEKAFSEMYRVLKPGGRLIFSTWESTTKMPFFKLLFDDTFLPFFKSADKQKYVVPFHMHDPVALEQLMLDAGFIRTAIEKVSFKGTSPSPEDLVNGFVYRHQLGRELREQEAGADKRLGDFLQRAIGERFGKDPVTVDLIAYIGAGIK